MHLISMQKIAAFEVTHDTQGAKFISVPTVSSISPEGNGDPDTREVCLPVCL